MEVSWHGIRECLLLIQIRDALADVVIPAIAASLVYKWLMIWNYLPFNVIHTDSYKQIHDHMHKEKNLMP